jgi:hypothetical protein
MAIAATTYGARAGHDSATSASFIITFVTMHTFVWISCSIMILTVVFYSNKHPQPKWINLNFSWILACFVFAFLLTTGQLFEANPDPSICLFQAAGVNAVTTLTAGTTLAFALQLWFNVVLDSYSNPTRRQVISVRNRDVLLIVIPFIVPLLEFFVTLGYALRNPHRVVLTDSGMFCGLTNPILGKISVIYSTILMIPTLVVQGLLSLYAYRSWSRGSGAGTVQAVTIVRLGVFIIFVVVGIIVSVIKLISPSGSVVANILESLSPVSFALIFGLQRDFLRVWMFWPKPKVTENSECLETSGPGFGLLLKPKEGQQQQHKMSLEKFYTGNEDAIKPAASGVV